MRLAFHIAIALSILFLPWWATAAILVAACLLLERFYEAVLYGIAIDALYATPYGLYGHSLVWTTASALLFIACQPLRKRLAW